MISKVIKVRSEEYCMTIVTIDIHNNKTTSKLLTLVKSSSNKIIVEPNKEMEHKWVGKSKAYTILRSNDPIHYTIRLD